MSEQNTVEYLRRAVAELRATKARLRELEDERSAPIAVVGFDARYPGADTPAALWDLVASGRDAIGPAPTDRGWRDTGPLAERGGFLRTATKFDPDFFGISPREALAMDPQQRLALEVSWSALEHAGIDPKTLRGSDTGVFTGANQQEYGPPLQDSPARSAGHRLTGAANSVIAGRVAYVLGLNGPVLTVDTACSASLVAIHLALRSLRDRESSLALAGGVTVLSTPGTMLEFDRLGGVAPDGRCKSFGAGADGIGLAEGAGVVVLERLDDARRNGHRVWAVLRGSSINSDGASNGLSAPSGPAQQKVIRQALRRAGLTAAAVDVLEAHGTGTALGDPIEANAVLATYGAEHDRDRPLWLGSLKSNIGHTQAAGGVGSVIKLALALAAETLPPTLHADHPTPHVDWSPGTVRLLSAAQPWPRTADHVRRAAVSSFGISGTNAHLILEEPPPEPYPVAGPHSVVEPRPAGELRSPAESRPVAGLRPPPEPHSPTEPRPAGGPRPAELHPAADPRPVAEPRLLAGPRPVGEPRPADKPHSPAEPHPVAGLHPAAEPHPAGGPRPAELYPLAGLHSPVESRPETGLRTAAEPHSSAGPRSVPALLLSARTEPALRDRAHDLAAHLRTHPDVPIADVARSLAARTNWPERAAVTGDLLAGLDALAAGQPHRDLARDTARPGATALVFTGQGGRFPDLGAYRDLPVFAAAFDAACAAFDPTLARTLRDALLGAEPEPLRRTEFAQPALVVLQVALARLLADWGITPDIVLGHSVGEIAAAHVAGVLSLTDAATLAAQRGRLMQTRSEPGSMLAARSSEADLAPLLVAFPVAVAAVNGAKSLLVAGEDAAVAEFAAAARKIGIATRPVPVQHAFHTPLVGPALPGLRAAADRLTHHPAEIPLVSTLTGKIGAPDGGEYWARHAAEPVAFAAALRTAITERGVDRVLVLGPDEGLVATIRRDHPDLLVTAARPDAEALVTVAARWYVRGSAVRAEQVLPGRIVPVPTYPFQRRRFWLTAGSAAGPVEIRDTLSVQRRPWLADHVVSGATLLPGTALLDLALRVAEAAGAPHLADLVLRTPVDLSGGVEREIRAVVEPGPLPRSLRIESRPTSETEWTEHATGTITDVGQAPDPAPVTGVESEWAAAGMAADVGKSPDRALVSAVEDGWSERVVGAVTGVGEVSGVASGTGVEGGWVKRAAGAVADGGQEPDSALVTDVEGGSTKHAAGAATDVGEAAGPASGSGVEVAWAERAAGAVTDVVAPASSAEVELSGHRERYAHRGIEYGPAFAGLTSVRRDGTVLVAEATPPAVLNTTDPLHPAVLDALLQALLTADDDGPPALPFAFTDVQRHAAATGRLRARIAPAAADGVSVVVTDERGTVVLTIGALRRRSAPALLLLPGWTSVEVRPDPAATVLVGRSAPELLASWDSSAPSPVLVLRSETPAGDPVTALHAAVQATHRDLLALLKADDTTRLVLLTENSGTPDPIAAAVQGFWRSAATEHPGRIRLVDTDDTAASRAALPALLTAGPSELTVRDGVPHTRTLLPATRSAATGPVPDPDRPVSLTDGATALPAPLSAGPPDPAIGDGQSHASTLLPPPEVVAVEPVFDPDGPVPIAGGTAASRLAAASPDLTVGDGAAHAPTPLPATRAANPGPVFDPDGMVLIGDGTAGSRPVRPARLAAGSPELAARDGVSPARAVPPLPEAAATGPVLTVPITGDTAATRPALLTVDPPDLTGVSHAPALLPATRPVFDPDRTVLITGGTGALGAHLARHLVARHGVRHLVLVSRRGSAAPEADRLRDELGATVVAADLADPEQVRAVLAGIPADRPLGAVVHTAGVVRDAPVTGLRPEQLDEVLAAKADSAWHLHDQTRHLDLAVFCLYSSLAGTLGTAGQAGYAAANAFLDALAARRSQEGLPATAIAWGWWDGPGMAGRLSERDHDRLRATGLDPMPAVEALARFDAAVRGAEPFVVAARLRTPPNPAEPPPDSAEQPTGSAEQPPAGSDVLAVVRAQTAAVLGHPGPDAVPPDHEFDALGLDSLTLVELRTRLTETFGRPVALTALLDHPTPRRLAEHLDGAS
jgi:acyl transferase domain-containing protein/NADP-dependent 3-hydroxy acid dehydrogenase YdfG/acyl carrier protein